MKIMTLVAFVATTFCLQAAHYHVSNTGSDKAKGNRSAPFRTIQKAADSMSAGDTCIIHAGRYRESVVLKHSGKSGKPIVFKAAEGEKVIIDGTDLVESRWQKDGNGIFKAHLEEPTDQVFYKDEAMMWARFPNMKFNENWDDAKKWARTDEGSEVGSAVSKRVAALGASLEGSLFFIKLGKGNNCFSRKVLKHKAGQSVLKWDASEFLDNPRKTAEDGESKKIEQAGLVGNRFFIKGSKLLLDAEHEWFHSNKALFFIPPNGKAPEKNSVAVKRRVYGFQTELVDNIVIEGLNFFACSLHFDKVKNFTMDGCHFNYPYELHKFHDNPQVTEDQRPVYIHGEDCTVRSSLVRNSPGSSLYVVGRGNIIENTIVTEGSRHGRHNDPNITLRYDHRNRHGRDFIYSHDKAGSVRHCTIFNGSGIGVYLLGKGPTIAEYNHVFNVGQYCTDVSALYIPLGRDRRWTGFHHNWIHDINGIGIRCDQDGEKVVFHHNVVWNCKAGGKLNGYECRAFNNTIFVDNPSHAFLMVLQGQDELMTQWPVQNNVAFRLADRRDLREMKKLTKAERKKRKFIVDLKESPSIHHNLIINKKSAPKLFVSIDENNTDLRPCKGSKLINKGSKFPGITDGYKGSAPDIGAYEYGGTYWQAGANWWPDGQEPPKTMPEATQRAHAMTGNRRLYKHTKDKYRHQ